MQDLLGLFSVQEDAANVGKICRNDSRENVKNHTLTHLDCDLPSLQGFYLRIGNIGKSTGIPVAAKIFTMCWLLAFMLYDQMDFTEVLFLPPAAAHTLLLLE